MRMNEVSYPDSRPVEGYGTGFFRVGGEVVQGGLLILPSGVRPWSGYDDLSAILDAADSIDVLFLGTGREIAHIPDTVRGRLVEAGIGVEVMASAPACRSYNVLLSEGRRIALAALPVE